MLKALVFGFLVSAVAGGMTRQNRVSTPKNFIFFDRERQRITEAGIAVQDSNNLEEKNPATAQPVTVAELYDFATTKLRLDYIVWGMREPYYTTRVLPFLHALARPS